eukprot:SAG31_NODE_6039_length_2197_cov_1.136320_4_plen_56_part_00
MDELGVQGGDAEQPSPQSLREIIFEAFEEPVSSPVVRWLLRSRAHVRDRASASQA